MHRPSLPLALLAIFAFTRVIHGTDFFDCLAKSTPAYAPATQSYVALVGLGLRNDTASPAAIVLARNPSHVSDAVRCARRVGLSVCARSGGHSFIGQSLCDGVLVDVGPMRSVSVAADGVATVQTGVIMGELLWAVWRKGRWLGAGVCPSVGVGGYMFGGGHNPYEGKLGLACDSLVDVTMVDRFGKIIVASKSKRKELFWGLCGAGGGQFGIITSFRVKTVDVARYDRSVIFRFTWKKEYVGELMEKWMDYKEMDGDVWFRITINANMGKGNGMIGHGICYDVADEEECMARLQKADFFNTTGREKVIVAKVKNALQMHAFFGPGGRWGRAKRADDIDFHKGLLDQRYSEAGFANKRTYKSTFLKTGKSDRPSAAFWQSIAEKCAKSGFESIPWTMCELNLFNGEMPKPKNNAFAHRGADIVTHYVVGGGSKGDLSGAYNQMKDHLEKYTTGVYVNYPELELKDEYAKAYWGENLWRLRQLKAQYDPDVFFANPQPIPPAPSGFSLFSWAGYWDKRWLSWENFPWTSLDDSDDHY